MSESAQIDKHKKKAKPSGLRPQDYAGTIHFHMNGSLHKMTGISISNQDPIRPTVLHVIKLSKLIGVLF